MIKTVLKAGAALLAAAALLASPALLSTSAHAAVAGRMPAGDDVYRDWYTSHSNCVTAGQGGIDRGHWDHYTCSEGDWLWHLWTNR